MLKKEVKIKLKALGFDVDKLEAAVKADDEQDFAIPEINNLTPEQLAERDKNTIAAAKPDIFATGKKAGLEIAGKAFVKKYGLEDVDVNDPDKIITALDAKVVKGDSGLQEQIKLLQKDKETLAAAVESEKTNSKALQFDTDLITNFPANRSGLTDKEFLMLTKGSLQFEEIEGVRVVKKDGQVLRDTKTQAPIPVKDAINSLFTERKWIGEASGGGGRGGGDNSGSGGGAGLKTFSRFSDQYMKDNPQGSLLSPEFQTAVQTAAKATTDFDWDK